MEEVVTFDPELREDHRVDVVVVAGVEMTA